MAAGKKIIKNRPSTEAENLDKAVPIFTDGASKHPINKYRRGEDTSLRGEEIKFISVGLEDIDQAVLYYFQEVIRPTVNNEGTTQAVPIMYSDPEKWKSAQTDGGMRDKEGRILFPVIVFKRDNIERNRNISNKLDGNFSNVYQVYEKKYSKKNHYDNFSVLTNRAPVKEFYNVVVPDYYTVTYTCAIYVSYMSDLNKMIESIGYKGDSYWGPPNKFLFKATADSFPITSQTGDGEDRKIICTFTLSLNGYLTPNNLEKYLSSIPFKSFSKPKITFITELSSKDSEVFSVASKKDVALAATSYIPEGVNVYNTFVTNTTISDNILAYLDTNISKKADFVSEMEAYFYSASILQPPSGSSLPATSVSDFKFFANGVFIPEQHIVSFATTGSQTILTINTASLGYALDNQDEIIGVGKFA